jgi:NAD(P)-dependent dehydrogenase (short-subunit alcohol dehydrogenase family)
MPSLQGKVAIVTGGAAGIGAAAATALAEEGARVVIVDVQDERGEELAHQLTEKGAVALYVHCDVADDRQVAAMVARTVDAFGHLDVAFNNAGIEGQPAPTADCTPDNWARTIAVNLTGVWHCMRHEIPRMLEAGGGSIINCSSVAGLVGSPNVPAYVASKHGVVGLTKTAALEYAETGIRVNAVCPGVIRTEMIDRFTAGDPEALEQLAASEPVGRLGTPDEVADAVVWLASDRSSFVTGQALAVDGGMVAR